MSTMSKSDITITEFEKPYMPKFAANLSMMYPELPFLDRFEAAAKDGFKAVEYLFPYAYAPKELASRLKINGLQQVLFNLPPGGVDANSIDAAWNAGTRGIACIPGREAELLAGASLGSCATPKPWTAQDCT